MSTTTTFPRAEQIAAMPETAALPDRDREFLERIYATPAGRYEQTIRAAGLTGLARVADLGCGYGQWAACLAAHNEAVEAIDVSPHRVDWVAAMARTLGFDHLRAHVGRAEDARIERPVDGLLSFGVMQYVDTAAFFATCASMVRPGGVAYVLGKDVGGYLRDWFEQRNRSAAFDPRAVTVSAFLNSLSLDRTGAVHPDAEWTDRIVPSETAAAEARRAGFDIVHAGPEGSLVEQRDPAPAFESHFFTRHFEGLPNSYELLLRRREDGGTDGPGA
jgi:SAM-dependent methyltransferase